jgi:hypothetical protein
MIPAPQFYCERIVGAKIGNSHDAPMIWSRRLSLGSDRGFGSGLVRVV